MQDKQNEQLLKEKQRHLEHECFLKESEFKCVALSSSTKVEPSGFDVVKNIRVVGKAQEASPAFSIEESKDDEK